jgi:DNA (cytosine-5)-methyltransferase 1
MKWLKWLEVFAGIGGVRCGLDMAGHETLAAIELQPAIAACYRVNHPDDKMIVSDVRDVDIKSLPSTINAIWCSPVCKSDSKARSKTLAPRDDAAIGKAMLPYIDTIQPELFILENVEAYRYNPAYHAILATLLKHHYTVSERVLNAADYGVPQSRKRLILQARRGPIAWPDYAPRHIGWHEAIQDMLPALEETTLIPWQVERWKSEYDAMLPLIVNGHFDFDRGTGVRDLVVVPGSKPIGTITSSHNNRDKRIVLQDKRVLRVSIDVLARLQSFPNGYQWSGSQELNYEMAGNAVPPLMVQALTKAYAGCVERPAQEVA